MLDKVLEVKLIKLAPDYNCDGGNSSSSSNNSVKQVIEVSVIRSRLMSSVFFRNLLADCSASVNDGREDNTVIFPPQYNDTFDAYVRYLQFFHIEVKPFKRCLQLCHFLEDKDYFLLLVNELLLNWSVHNNDDPVSKCGSFDPHKTRIDITDLSNDLREEIYLRTPYQLLPEQLIMSGDFFDKWLKRNKNRDFDIYSHIYDSRRYGHHIYVISDKLHSITSKYSNSTTMYDLHGVERQWYASGKIHYVWPRRYNKPDGIFSSYYNSQDDEEQKLASEETYCNGKKHGISKYWYVDGTLGRESNYNHGSLHGITKAWWSNGQLKFQHNYCCGSEDGWQEGYYETGIKKYQIHYNLRRRFETSFYDKDGNLITKAKRSERKMWECEWRILFVCLDVILDLR